MPFQIHALPPELFAALFALPDADLANHRAKRMTVFEHPGTPCRVSLADAEKGETVLLINYGHLPDDSPYRSAHAIFVRQGACQARPAIGEVPAVLQSRLISLRVFDAGQMMIDADVVDGADLHNALVQAFADPDADFVHLHYAKPGCFAASVTRTC